MDNEHNRALTEGHDDPLLGPGAHRDGSPEVPAAKPPRDPLEPALDDVLTSDDTNGAAIDELAERVSDEERVETDYSGEATPSD